MDRYTPLGKIGEGTYGVVFKAADWRTGDIMALKRIRLSTEEEGIPSTAIREVSILRQLDHPNIVRLLDVVHAPRRLTLVFEYVHQDLKSIIDACGADGLEPFIVKSFLFQLLQGLAYCHRNRILHRDMKPQNVLVDQDGNVKIADFGLARLFGAMPHAYTPEVVTLWYREPDVLCGSTNYGPAIDVWAIGCIFAEMVNGRPLFPGANNADQLRVIFSLLGTPTLASLPALALLPDLDPAQLPAFERVPLAQVCPRLDTVGLDLLDRMLDMNPATRITAQDALAHPFFRDLKLRRVDAQEEWGGEYAPADDPDGPFGAAGPHAGCDGEDCAHPVHAPAAPLRPAPVAAAPTHGHVQGLGRGHHGHAGTED